MRVLTWNLFHGRSVASAGYSLLGEFAAALEGWAWDIALLKEVPPWWPPALAQAISAQQRTALTSRNTLLPVRRFLAERRADVLKSQGGGANAILVRGGEIAEHRVRPLRRRPERRVVHAVRVTSPSLWIANVHAQVRPAHDARGDGALAVRAATGWAASVPLVLGGDFNVRDPQLSAGLVSAGGHDVDHVLARG